jgi:hypothetical protein
MSCAEQVFSDVTQAIFDCLAAKAQAADIPIRGNSGQSSKSGATVSWNFDPSNSRLSIRIQKLPFFISCASANNEISSLVEACRQSTSATVPGISAYDFQISSHLEASMTQDQDFMAALVPFRQPLMAAQSLDLCETYKQVKPVLQGVLPFVKAIPVIGQRTAQAIAALMAALDVLCAGGASGAKPLQATSADPDQQFLAALDAFQPGSALVSAQAEAFDLCGTYKKVKPILKGIAPFIKLIPVVGAAAGTAIELLMVALDAACSA